MTVDEIAIRLLTKHLSELCVACLDVDGNPKTPDRKALIKARSYLPKEFPGTLFKEKP